MNQVLRETLVLSPNPGEQGRWLNAVVGSMGLGPELES